jgi:hypothetical protein
MESPQYYYRSVKNPMSYANKAVFARGTEEVKNGPTEDTDDCFVSFSGNDQGSA